MLESLRQHVHRTMNLTMLLHWLNSLAQSFHTGLIDFAHPLSVALLLQVSMWKRCSTRMSSSQSGMSVGKKNCDPFGDIISIILMASSMLWIVRIGIGFRKQHRNSR